MSYWYQRIQNVYGSHCWLTLSDTAEYCLCKTYLVNQSYFKAAVTPLRWQWSYCSLALSHRFSLTWIQISLLCVQHLVKLYILRLFVHTARGHYVFMKATKLHAEYQATLETDFLYLKDSCLQIFYSFIGDPVDIQIAIKLRHEVSLFPCRPQLFCKMASDWLAHIPPANQ